MANVSKDVFISHALQDVVAFVFVTMNVKYRAHATVLHVRKYVQTNAHIVNAETDVEIHA